jgi:hypothetical protein
MGNGRLRPPPRWFFAVLNVGAFIACGIYLAKMETEGVSTGYLARSIGYAVFGLLMLWGVMGKR